MVNSDGGLMDTGSENLSEKYTLSKFRHAEKETNAMHCWVELQTPKFKH